MSGVPKNVFIGFDQSMNSVAALRWSLENLSLKTGDIITAIDLTNIESEMDLMMQQAKTTINCLATPHHTHLKYSVRVLLASKGFGHEICDLVNKEKPDLLVMGSSAKSFLQGMTQGSVSHYCVEHAKCPTIVVRVTPADEMSAQEAVNKQHMAFSEKPLWI
ncbi:hypothetical protein HDU98_006542 [Podochytrium sp. JEL0797]|nr:hypothetical protein HDU98_006542 [Podochytrium sp. JEL0797]